LKTACDCEQVLTIDPDFYARFHPLVDGLDHAAQLLHESGGKEDLDEVLRIITFYMAPATAWVLCRQTKERT